MFDHNANANDAVSRRNVLKTAGGILAGSTALAGLGAERGAAETEDGLQIEVREMTEEYIAVKAWFPQDVFDEVEFPQDVFLGHADRFVIHEDGEWVSLPEDTEGLANPVEEERLDPDENGVETLLYFRTRAIQWPQDFDGEEVMLGLGGFPDRTVPHPYFDACPGHRDY